MYSYEHLGNIPPIPTDNSFQQPDQYIKELVLAPRATSVRDKHRDPLFEDQMTLVDQKYRLVAEINQIRSENEALKKDILEKNKEVVDQGAALLEAAKRVKTEEENAYQFKRVLDAQKRLDDLLVLSNELNSQYNFLNSFFSFAKEEDIRSYAGLQSNQAHNESMELEQIEAVLQKAINRLEGPVAANRQIYEKQQAKIQKLSQYLTVLVKEDQEYYETAIKCPEPQILPEELIAERDELKHRLQVLQHRRYNRTKELQQTKRRAAVQRIAAGNIQVEIQKARREENERIRFRNRMQRKHQLEYEEELRRKNGESSLAETEPTSQAVPVDEEEDLEEKWRMITSVNQAHDQSVQQQPQEEEKVDS